MKQENTGGGGRRAILTRSSASPRGFTLYYLCVLHLDRVFAARSSPSIVPSFPSCDRLHSCKRLQVFQTYS